MVESLNAAPSWARQATRGPRARTWLWLIVAMICVLPIGIACAVALHPLVVDGIQRSATGDASAAMLGPTILGVAGVAAIAWVGLFALALRESKPIVWIGYFLALLATSAVLVWSFESLDMVGTRRNLALRDIRRLRAENIRTFKADHDAYLQAIRSLQIFDVLSPGVLAHEDIRRKIAEIGKARALVTQYRARYDAHVAEVRAQVARIKLAPAERGQVLKGLERSLSATLPLAQESFDLDDRFCSELAQTLSELQASRGAWEVRGVTTVFGRPADLQRYRMHVASLNSMHWRSVQVQQQLAEMTRRADAIDLGR